MGTNIELKKVDAQGRIVLPLEWRDAELKDNQEVLVIRENDVLRIVPKRRIDLTQFFDTLDFGIDLDEDADDWKSMEKKILMKKLQDEKK
ncbi:MAG TPA: AbrB/MazE/SpoVT family DNA-binding domain-containing protein [Candidatus Lokiarchaeia archaeon]|nr:AbrB/MazE/SpoVT family DNA-binding domain-containing protein [Candidatus Lokiarchaeia archaeon]